MPTSRPYREVVPNDSVLFEEVLEALRESQLATAIEARVAQARDQDCHGTTERLTTSSELTSTRIGSMLMALPFSNRAFSRRQREQNDIASAEYWRS